MSSSSPSTRQDAGLYVAIIATAIGVVAAVLGLAYLFTREARGVVRVLPANATIAFARTTDLATATEWTSGPILRPTGSGSTASGSTLVQRINAATGSHGKVLANLARLDPAPQALSIAILQGPKDSFATLYATEWNSPQQAGSFLASLQATPTRGDRIKPEAAEAIAISMPGTLDKAFALRVGSTTVLARDAAVLRSIAETANAPRGSLARSGAYRSGGLPQAAAAEIYIDYPKATATLRTSYGSGGTARDLLTLFAPLDKQVSSVAVAAERATPGYRFRGKIGATQPLLQALAGPSQAQAPTLPQDAVLSISGTSPLGGYRRLARFLSTEDRDAGTVMEALARYMISTYVAPSLSAPEALNRLGGGYAVRVQQAATGNRSVDGWVSGTQDEARRDDAVQWLKDFAANSRLMFNEREREQAGIPERFLEPIPFSLRQDALPEGGWVDWIATNDDNRSPALAVTGKRLYFASSRTGVETLLRSGGWSATSPELPGGQFALRIDLPGLMGHALGPIRNIALSLRADGDRFEWFGTLQPIGQ